MVVLIRKLLTALILIPALIGAELTLPDPNVKAQREQYNEVRDKGKEEIISLLKYRNKSLFFNFVFGYISGSWNDLRWQGANPSKLKWNQMKNPALILIHGDDSNQGTWLPFIENINKVKELYGINFNIFTIHYTRDNGIEQLQSKIRHIKNLYKDNNPEIILIGHSYGALIASEYAYTPTLHIKDTNITKIISIAGRLKNINPAYNIPYYDYAHEVLNYVHKIENLRQKNGNNVILYTMVGDKEWLIPQESCLVGKHKYIISDAGHVNIIILPDTALQIIKFLIN